MDENQKRIDYVIQEIEINLKHSQIEKRFFAKINTFWKKDKEKINKALIFARQKHDWVYRRDNVTPYIYHPILVATYCMEFDSSSVEDVCACILHDVLEDTSTPSDEISRLFGEQCCQKVLVLSKNFDNTEVSIDKYVQWIIKDKDSIRNKSCDIFANAHGSIFLWTNEEKNRYLSKILDVYAPIIKQTEKQFPQLYNLILASITYSQNHSITEEQKNVIKILSKNVRKN